MLHFNQKAPTPVYFNTETKVLQLEQYFRKEEKKNVPHVIKVTARVFKARLDGAVRNLV